MSHGSGCGETQVCFAHCQGDHENTWKHETQAACHVCHVSLVTCFETRYVWQPGLLYGMWLVPLRNKFEALCCHLKDWNWSFAGVWSCYCHQLQSCESCYLRLCCLASASISGICRWSQCTAAKEARTLSHFLSTWMAAESMKTSFEMMALIPRFQCLAYSVYMCHSTIRQFENALELYSDTAVAVTIRCHMSDIVFWLRTTHFTCSHRCFFPVWVSIRSLLPGVART